MRQSRRQAVANARRTASNKVNRRRTGTSSPRARTSASRARTSASRARMRSATGEPVAFQRQAGEFISVATPRSTQQKASIAVTKLMPFL